jgi:hypothetical protein
MYWHDSKEPFAVGHHLDLDAVVALERQELWPA